MQFIDKLVLEALDRARAMVVNECVTCGDLSVSEVQVCGDPDDLRSAFGEIFLNALQSSDKPVIKIRRELQTRVIIYSIEDNGPGLTEQQIALSRVPGSISSKDALGCGIAIARNIFTCYGGSLELIAGTHGFARISLPVVRQEQ